MRRRVTGLVPETRGVDGPEAPARGRGSGLGPGACRALGAALGLILVAPATALAQGLWTFTPSLQLAEKYTDNVFGTAHDRQSDFITQITPGIALTYELPLFKVSLSYGVTAEIYADNSDLDNFGDNQNGSLGLEYRPEERLTLHLGAYYARTNDPSQFLVPGVAPPGITPVPTVETTRIQTTQFTLSAGADYRFTPRLSGNAGYSFSYLKQEGTEDSQSHTGSLGATYQLTRQDQGFSTASVSYFDATDSDTSATLLVGWRRQWTSALGTSVGVGPRITGDTWGGAADASLTYLPGREWSVTLTYSLGTGLAVGTTGAQNVSSLGAAIGYQATRDLSFRATGGWARTWPLDGGPNEETTDAYTVGISGSYRLTTWLVLALDYRFIVEDGSQRDTVRTNEVVLGLTASYPFRK